ncbi:hypothetical protein SAMN05414139_09245 [Burkholderia sp. D7]|nr:hypothetical protein SAMN05414139_09245 [Burkholderia sp. D7]
MMRSLADTLVEWGLNCLRASLGLGLTLCVTEPGKVQICGFNE